MSPVFTRFPQPVDVMTRMDRRPREEIARIVRARRMKNGISRAAMAIERVDFESGEGELSAVDLRVVMVRVKVLVVLPGGKRVGLKMAMAPGGRPVAARIMGLLRVPWV